MTEYKRRLRKLLHDSGEFPMLNMVIISRAEHKRLPHDRHSYEKVLVEELHVSWLEIDRWGEHRPKVIMVKQDLHKLLSVPKEDLPLKIIQGQMVEPDTHAFTTEHKLTMAVHKQRLQS